MALSTVTTGNTILASDVNQLVNALQVPSGSTETGHYFICGWASAASQVIGINLRFTNNNSTPVSITTDTSDGSFPGGTSAVTTGHLTRSGCQCYVTSGAAGNNIAGGGLYTAQF